MNFGLMATKAETRRFRNMNIIERSAFWFRYERNGQSPREDEDHSIEETHTPEPEWTKRERYIVNQLRADNEHLRKQWYEHLKEDREYRAKKSEKPTHIYKHK